MCFDSEKLWMYLVEKVNWCLELKEAACLLMIIDCHQ
jgi:hypothetical protein